MNKFLYMITIFTILFFIGCQNKFSFDKDLTKKSYTFYNQDSVKVIFPETADNKITVVGFIYTNCPDICPMTIHNLYLTEQKLAKVGINDVNFVLITFDPGRDYPSVLKKFAEIRDIKFDNWSLLWNTKQKTDSLLMRLDILAIPTDSSYTNDGELVYSVMHTDRISLIDREGHLRKNYKGSTVNLDELYNDIKILGDY
jgi:protein SCO1